MFKKLFKIGLYASLILVVLFAGMGALPAAAAVTQPDEVEAPVSLVAASYVYTQHVKVWDCGHGHTNPKIKATGGTCYAWGITSSDNTIIMSAIAPNLWQFDMDGGGTTTTLAGDSPSGNSTVGADIVAQYGFDYSFKITSSATPVASGSLVAFDNTTGTGPIASSYSQLFNKIFGSGNWSWASGPAPYEFRYTTCLNGTWIDASYNNDGKWGFGGGDIKGDNLGCPGRSAGFVPHPTLVLWIIRDANGGAPCTMWIWDGGSPSFSPGGNIERVCRSGFVGMLYPPYYIYGSLNGVPMFQDGSGMLINLPYRPLKSYGH